MIKQTARTRYEVNKTEALRRLALIKAAIEAGDPGDKVHWGHVEGMYDVVQGLSHIGHLAGVPELTEK